MLRELRLELLAGAVQPRHHCTHRHAQRLGDFGVAPVLDVEEGDHLAVARGQGGDGAIEVALRLLFLDPLLARDGEVVLELRSDAGLGSVVAPALGERQGGPAPAEEIDAVVARDAQDPGGERLARVEVADAGVGAHERFLRGVARLFAAAEQAIAEPVDRLLVLLNEARERDLVAARRSARPLRLVGRAGGPGEVSCGRQGHRERECRVHGRFYGGQAVSISRQKRRRSISRQARPAASGRKVQSAPTQRKRRKGILPFGPASSNTIRFATDATGVRLPASVATSARASHPRCGSASFGTQCAASRTNGTLLTSWQAATVKRPNRNVCCVASWPRNGESAAWMRSAIPACATPCVTTNRPAKNRSRVPSTCANSSLGRCRENVSRSAAPVIAVQARLNPSRNPARTKPSAAAQRSASFRSSGGGGTSSESDLGESSRRNTIRRTQSTMPRERIAGRSSAPLKRA